MKSQRLPPEGASPHSIRLTTNTDGSQGLDSSRSFIGKTPQVKSRWEIAAAKVKSRGFIKSVNEDILLFGTTHELVDANNIYKPTINQVIEERSKKQDWFRRVSTSDPEEKLMKQGLISPTGFFRQFWNPVMVLALTYTATVMPYRVAFFEENLSDPWSSFDFCIDFLFAADIIINFWSMYVKPDGTWEIHHSKIVKHYLSSWFLIDLFACLPFSLLNLALGSNYDGASSKYNTFTRLLRIPRMYKLLRIFRILKAVRYYRHSRLMERLQDFLQINSRIFKMLKFLIYVFISVHIAACLWFFTARLYDFSPDTWVVRFGLTEYDEARQYLASFYWACTTVVTVGYGDISAETQLEMIAAIIWMIIGGGFYSYTIGSLSSILSSLDTRDSLLAQKIANAKEIAKETGLSNGVLRQIIYAIQYHTSKTGSVWNDRHALFAEIPKELRFEVASTMYGGVIKDIYTFKHKQKAFINFVMPLFSPMRIQEEKLLYRTGEYADEIYFITFGRACFLILPQKATFKMYLKGSYFGEVEILFGLPRVYNCACVIHTELFVLHKADFLALLKEFPNEKKEMMHIAHERRRRDKQRFAEMSKLLTMKQLRGNLHELAGKTQIRFEDDNSAGDDEDIEERLKIHMEQLKEVVEEVKESVRQFGRIVKKIRRKQMRR